VVVCTMLPRTGTDAERAAYNTAIRANWATYADALADPAADARIGDNGDNADLTYYDADAVHLNDAGYAIAAAIIEPQILALL
jgi:lysophospholipase L1-like esterase